MKERLLQFAKSFGAKIIDQRFHFIHRQQAKKVLKSIEDAKGITDPKLLALSNEYANEVLGWQGYAPWLYVYSAIAGEFKEGWIPDNYYGAVVVPAIQGDYGGVSHLKGFTNKIFQSTVFPDLAYYTNGLFLLRDYKITSFLELKEQLFKDNKTIVYKTDSSYQGRGVYFLEKASFDIKKIELLGNGVFQSFIEQHTFFNAFMPDSAATIRITTTLNGNGIAVLNACYLRLGRKEDTHVKSKSHIRIPIKPESGKLDSLGYLPNWQTIDEHPDSLLNFSDKPIPCFEKCVSTALDLHEAIPMVGCIGWDMTVDKDENIKVMEWNGSGNDIKFTEATQGPNFSTLGWENLWRKNK